MVYLPMGYLYGARFVYAAAASDPLIAALKHELYLERRWASIDWASARESVAPTDNYSPIHPLMKVAQRALLFWEERGGALKRSLRRRGLAYSLDYMRAEDLQTNFIDIGPVNKVFNMLSCFHAAGGDVNAENFQRHVLRVPDYLWVAEDGLSACGLFVVVLRGSMESGVLRILCACVLASRPPARPQA